VCLHFQLYMWICLYNNNNNSNKLNLLRTIEDTKETDRMTTAYTHHTINDAIDDLCPCMSAPRHYRTGAELSQVR